MIERIYKWNEQCGNSEYNRNLESSMMSEEFAEYIIALKEKDIIETVDAVIDMFIIWIGTLYKLGVSSSDVDKAIEEILRSNDSKLVNGEVVKQDGKIVKPESFSPASLSFIKTNK